jgi:hypothetical protein
MRFVIKILTRARTDVDLTLLHNFPVNKQRIGRRCGFQHSLSIGSSALMKVEKVEFDISLAKNSYPKLIYVYFFDLVTKRNRAFAKLKESVHKGGKVIAIVCGGDGTIMWVVSELYNHSINPAKMAIGVLPLGTGNDFSQYLGWGKQKNAVIENKYRHLKKLIRRWLLAKEEDFDIWDMVAEVHEVRIQALSVANSKE